MQSKILEIPGFYLRILQNIDCNKVYELYTAKADSTSSNITIEKVQSWILRWNSRLKDFGFGKYAVIDSNDDKIVGIIGFEFMYDPEHKSNPLLKTPQVLAYEKLINDKTFHGDFELGYYIHEDYRNRGLASELAKAICNWAFINFPIERIVAVAHIENIASQKVLERVGFKYIQNVETMKFGIERFYKLDGNVAK